MFALFCIQLLLNILWRALFFGLRSPGVALAEIIVLWLAFLATTFLATALFAYRTPPMAG